MFKQLGQDLSYLEKEGWEGWKGSDSVGGAGGKGEGSPKSACHTSDQLSHTVNHTTQKANHSDRARGWPERQTPRLCECVTYGYL